MWYVEFTSCVHTKHLVDYVESEIITNNDQFLTDGSGAFRSLNDALKHFDKLSGKLVHHDNVDDLSYSDTELIRVSASRR
jgi:hypothetical protein